MKPKQLCQALKKKSLLTGEPACALQVIKSVNFDWDQCPINVL